MKMTNPWSGGVHFANIFFFYLIQCGCYILSIKCTVT